MIDVGGDVSEDDVVDSGVACSRRGCDWPAGGAAHVIVSMLGLNRDATPRTTTAAARLFLG